MNPKIGAQARAEAFLRRLSMSGDIIDASRVAVIVAHPDDETIGVGAQLPRLRGISILHVTDGSPRALDDARNAGFDTREGYALARRRELEAAMTLAGVPSKRLYMLGLVDQEAALDLAGLARRIAAFIEEHRIEVVLTHPYEGGHPDHDSTCFAIHLAAEQLVRRGREPLGIVEMGSYHAGPGSVLRVQEFLPRDDRHEIALWLDPAAQALKARLFACHASQLHVLQRFATDIERFRASPDYDFTAPPHPGVLWYETRPWRITGAGWRTLAQAAREELEREP